jgi:hypothetical protein
MPKGLFTQTACVLLKGPVACEQLERALALFPVVGRQEAGPSWAFGGPTVTLAFRPEVNGLVAVDVVDQTWPDTMGDPQKEPMLFAAWSMGNFGPFTFPGGLERAGQQSWAWQEGKTVAGQHTGFIRIRSSYVFGAGEDAPVMPADYYPVGELLFTTEVALAVLGLPEALCYFNPNGEVLRDRDGLRESLDGARSANLLPLDLWSNVRLFNLEGGWSLMDTVGNGQLDLPDIGACFPRGYDYGEVERFLRNVTWYLHRQGQLIKDGDTMDGPGGIRWQAHAFENSLSQPPRQVLGWRPLDESEPPEVFLKR